ncbi:MAG TPA: hypothetical protein VM677_16540 [Actinokineospora sp.]|nr:hypothetical protein [Actinokineospora sp.]
MHSPSTVLDSVDPTPEVTPARRSPRLGRLAVHAAWVALLAVGAVARVGRFGFNPTDQGFVLSLSHRLLDGQVPHRDIISPRPLGSAALHVVDLLLPGPLFAVSGFIVMVEIAVATIACAALVTRTSPLAWNPLVTGLVAAATLLNMNVFPLMAWHTIDGIMLTAVGWWAVDSGLRVGSTPRRLLGLALLGFAVMTKQSFMFAVPVGLLLVVAHPAARASAGPRERRWWGRLGIDLVALGLVPVGYFALVTVAGGLPAAIAQLTGGTGTWGDRFIDLWNTAGPRDTVLLAVVCALVGAVLTLVARARPWLPGIPASVIAACALYTVVDGGLAGAGNWAVTLTWLLVCAAVLHGAVHRALPWRPLLVALLAYMAALSWGYPSPTLMGGTLTLSVLAVAYDVLPRWSPAIPRRAATVVSAAVAAALVVGTGVAVADAHDRAPYADQPQGALTVDLGSISPELRFVRTTPEVARYVGQIKDCLDRHPAGQVAILPDNPFAYPVFGLRSPFPMDWPLTLELVADARDRMLTAATDLDARGDYLVLFQTVRAHDLTLGARAPESIAPTTPIAAYGPLEGQINARLTGARITCGSFHGVWAR